MNEFQILSKQMIAQRVKRIDVRAPAIASKARPGQFVLVMPQEKIVRLAIPIVEINPQKESVTLVFKEENAWFETLGNLWIGDSLFAMSGPWGMPESVDQQGTVVCIGYELGVASLMFLSRQLRQMGNKVIGIIGAETKGNMILESQMRVACQRIVVLSADGTVGRKAEMTTALREICDQQDVSCVYAAGPLEIIQRFAEDLKDKKIKMRAVLHPMTFNAMAMGSTSQISVQGQEVDVAVDGVIFDAQKIDWDRVQKKMKNFERIIS